MLEYSRCNKEQLIEVVEALAYQVLHYEYPTWYETPEEEVYGLLKSEGLPVQRFKESDN